MSNEDFDSMLAEITNDTDTPVATLPQEDKPVTEPNEDVPAHTDAEATMPDMPAPANKDAGQPMYQAIDENLKNTVEVANCETVKSVTVYPAGYSKISLNSGRKSNSFFLYEDQWDQLTELVRSEEWDKLKAVLKASGFRNRGQSCRV